MLVCSLRDITARDIDRVGGKGANLGELVRAGFAVPDGFVLTTEAFSLAARAAGVDPRDPVQAAERLRATPVPDAIATCARDAYAGLGRGPVAVRSSATAEDLPGASFAGQQDTFLNVEGDQALLDAIQRCWASLWNDRAVAYRRANGIDDGTVSLAVVVQRMVPATAAGVLFTADPITGRRRRAVIDAIADLGEKLVSGAANPDHFVLDLTAPRVAERHLAGDQPVLADSELVALATLGDRVEQHFGAPQDIEFALDSTRKQWLVQSRPITTLFPLPADVPDVERDLRVYFCANVFQGYFAPITPMGIQFFRLIGSAVYRDFGAHVPDALAGPSELVEAGMRLFIDVTGALRDPLGRQVLIGATAAGEARSSAVLARLAANPYLHLAHQSRLRSVLRVARGFVRAGIPPIALRVLLSPDRTRARLVREMESIARVDLPTNADATLRLDTFERLVLGASAELLPRLLGIMAPTMLLLFVARRLLRGVATEDELQTVTRGAPGNPTTEMDLALWSLSVGIRSQPHARDQLLAAFLRRYGFRSVGEIDIGVPRWSEDPSHIVGVLNNYAQLRDDAVAPDAQFARGQREAETTIARILARLHGPKRLLLQFVLTRFRQLIGAREVPKYQIIRLLATPTRELLKPVGAELAARGRLAQPDDIFFLTLPEAHQAAAGVDVSQIATARRNEFDRERARRHIPRILLSDGTDAEVALVAPANVDGGGLRGTPASPGVVTGKARVILSPSGAHLEPGEILVAPSTDPGWTPLFLTAGGLVMEMGGMMSHGAVVAREYGIPAVVGLPAATERIVTGQVVSIDGSAGLVTID